MNKEVNELNDIINKFAGSGWELIGIPSKKWLKDKTAKTELIKAIEQADKECGSCGCEYDPLYKRALVLLRNTDVI